jgi:hypothetical protein
MFSVCIYIYIFLKFLFSYSSGQGVDAYLVFPSPRQHLSHEMPNPVPMELYLMVSVLSSRTILE